ncbi:hypothetical protein B0A48_15386 [Cryoendolithus antarcticus]|uniref:Uncharacterized protein n=1 Tax=Cryoendolithus antarcticus TaxID=1507870 RepID=A0A1V8SID0_9PEZI|nr:hypothetical protein B0A48_15386 [Cryoendolithus antarcticus]
MAATENVNISLVREQALANARILFRILNPQQIADEQGVDPTFNVAITHFDDRYHAAVVWQSNTHPIPRKWHMFIHGPPERIIGRAYIMLLHECIRLLTLSGRWTAPDHPRSETMRYQSGAQVTLESEVAKRMLRLRSNDGVPELRSESRQANTASGANQSGPGPQALDASSLTAPSAPAVNAGNARAQMPVSPVSAVAKTLKNENEEMSN